MKSVVSSVYIELPYGISVGEQTPLDNNDLRAGLENLVASLSGAESEYSVVFHFDGYIPKPSVTLAIGRAGISADVDVLIEADSWTAFINKKENLAHWDDPLPIGPLSAATMGVAEVFKHLIIRNYPDQSGRSLKFNQNLAFSLLNYNVQPLSVSPPVTNPTLIKNIAIAGVGAGGSTVVYALACMPHLIGQIVLIDPGNHKKSNISRYLLSSYDDCTHETSKVDRAVSFLARRQPDLNIIPYSVDYEDIAERKFDVVVSATDTPEARWNLQRDWPPVILDGAVLGTIYAVARIVPERGMCLGCKHPYDPDLTMKRIAWMWGKPLDVFKKMVTDDIPVATEDINLLAEIQGKDPEEFNRFLGVPFGRIPGMSDCGDARMNLQVPNQVATLPFVTTMVGLCLAAEVLKYFCAPQFALNNWFEHNMFWLPKPDRQRFRLRSSECHICSRRL
jgi:molybdopterin/thiamine biosynthesis adenylyltransferase